MNGRLILCLTLPLAGCVASRQYSCDDQKEQRAVDASGFALLATRVLTYPPGAPTTGGELHVVDLNADGRSDLLLNVRDFANRVFVSQAGYCGTYGPFEEARLDGPVGTDTSWSDAELLFAQLDNDRVPELVWSLRRGSENIVYIGRFDAPELTRLSVRGGTSVSEPDQDMDWTPYAPLVADLDGDQRDDVVWVDPNRDACAFVAFGTEDPGLSAEGGVQCLTYDGMLASTDLSRLTDEQLDNDLDLPTAHAEPMIADVDGDGQDELLFNYVTGSPNIVMVAQLDPGTRRLHPGRGIALREWLPEYFQPLAGNIDGLHGDDFLWVQPVSASTAVWSVLSGPAGTLSERGPDVALTAAAGHEPATLAQFDESVPADLLYTQRLERAHEVHVAYGTSDATFGMEAVLVNPDRTATDPPATAADVDGDGLDDLIWTDLDSDRVRVQVALSVAR